MTKKQLKDQAERDRRQRLSDKLGHSNYIRALQGETWHRCREMPYPMGFITSNGHWILSAWGFQGHALCGATVDFDSDRICHGQAGKIIMRQCCQMRMLRMQARLGYRKLTWTPNSSVPWHWYVPTDKLLKREGVAA
jgi:hypothetical protein